MLNTSAYLCGTTDQRSIHPANPKNLYIPKQKSFSYLTKSCNITFEQSFIRAVSRFDIIIGFKCVLPDFSICVS